MTKKSAIMDQNEKSFFCQRAISKSIVLVTNGIHWSRSHHCGAYTLAIGTINTILISSSMKCFRMVKVDCIRLSLWVAMALWKSHFGAKSCRMGFSGHYCTTVNELLCMFPMFTNHSPISSLQNGRGSEQSIKVCQAIGSLKSAIPIVSL